MPGSERAASLQDLNRHALPVERTLGVLWDVNTDLEPVPYIIIIIIIIIIIRWELRQVGSQWLNNSSFLQFFPSYGTCSFQYQLNSLGSIQPCCHRGAGNYSSTQANHPRCELRILRFSESNCCYIGRKGCRERDYFRTTVFFPANFVTLLAVISDSDWMGRYYFSAGMYTPNNIKL